LQRRAGWIADGIAAKGNNGVNKLRRVYRTIQRLRIDRLTTPHCKSIDFMAAIELRRTRSAATPPAERGTDNRAGCGIRSQRGVAPLTLQLPAVSDVFVTVSVKVV